MKSKSMIPTKSSQSGGRPWPLERAIATRAAASITQERGFHMKLRNCHGVKREPNHRSKGHTCKKGFCSSDSSLLGPKTSRRCFASASERPSWLHWRSLNTSSMTMVSRSTFSLSYKSSALSSIYTASEAETGNGWENTHLRHIDLCVCGGDQSEAAIGRRWENKAHG